MTTPPESTPQAGPEPRPRLELDPAWAWAPHEPSTAQPWNIALAGHLFRRAGFGASYPELQIALKQGPRATVDQLLAAADQPPDHDPVSPAALAAAARSGNTEHYVAWWLRRLLETPSALREKMTLFWHNYFAIDAAAVKDLPLFDRHIETLRALGLGDFQKILQAQLEDPAMFLALGGAANRRAQPNLAFARPWLIDFTVGPQVARDSDVHGTARALTGWFVYGGKLRWIEREHDEGNKEILGTTGNLGRTEVIQILARHPATSRRLAGRLFRWFVTETAEPSEALLAPLAAQLQGPGGVRLAVETLLRSNVFFSDAALGEKVKSPVELMVGLGRAFDVLLPTNPMARDLTRMGQPLTMPPTARGWSGGVNWINSITLVIRQKSCEALLTGADGYARALDPRKLAQDYGCSSFSAGARLWQDLLIPGGVNRALPDPAPAVPNTTPDLAAFVQALVRQPEFQIN